MRVAWPALTTLVAVGAAVLASIGSAPLPVVRAVVLTLLVLAIAAALGGSAAAAMTPAGAAHRRGRLLDVAAGGAAVWTIAAATSAFLLYLGQAPAISSPAFGPGLVTFATQVAVGRTWLVATIAAAVLTAVLLGVRSRTGVRALWPVVVLVAVPVALAGVGDGASLADRRTLGSAALVQLVALATWTGLAVLRPARGRRVAVGALGALVLTVAGAGGVLLQEGEIGGAWIAGAVAVVLAGVVAVARPRRSRMLQASVVPPLLGAAVGLDAAAAVTRELPTVASRTAPAAILTGAPLPPTPSPAAVLLAWQPDPVWLVVAAGLLAAYGVLLRRSAAAGSPVRTGSWVLGTVLLVWLTNGAPAVYQEVLFAPHLLQHLALLLVVPALLAAGAPLRLLAASGLAGAGRTRGSVRAAPALLTAVVAVAALYGTAVLQWTVSDPVGTEVGMLGCLVVGGALVHALGSASRRSAIAALLALLVLETAAAVLLAADGSLLLADWWGAMGWGTDALAAQRATAVPAWVVAVVPTAAMLVAALRRRKPSTSLLRPAGVPV